MFGKYEIVNIVSFLNLHILCKCFSSLYECAGQRKISKSFRALLPSLVFFSIQDKLHISILYKILQCSIWRQYRTLWLFLFELTEAWDTLSVWKDGRRSYICFKFNYQPNGNQRTHSQPPTTHRIYKFFNLLSPSMKNRNNIEKGQTRCGWTGPNSA